MLTEYLSEVSGDMLLPCGARIFFNLLKVPKNKLLDIFKDHVQMVNNSTNISRSLMDHVFMEKSLMTEFFTNVTVKNIYFYVML